MKERAFKGRAETYLMSRVKSRVSSFPVSLVTTNLPSLTGLIC